MLKPHSWFSKSNRFPHIKDMRLVALCLLCTIISVSCVDAWKLDKEMYTQNQQRQQKDSCRKQDDRISELGKQTFILPTATAHTACSLVDITVTTGCGQRLTVWAGGGGCEGGV